METKKGKIQIMIKQNNHVNGYEVWGCCKKKHLKECFNKMKGCFGTPSTNDSMEGK